MENKKLGFALVPVIVIVLVAIGIGGYVWVKQAQPISPSPEDGMVACTMDAKRCPDGSYVGRSGPNCEFEACSADNDLLEIINKPLATRVSDERMISLAMGQWPPPDFRHSARVMQIYRGDLNNDGFADAIVSVLGCGASCGEVTSLILDENGSPKFLPNARIPVRGYGAEDPSIRVVSIEDGIITVNHTKAGEFAGVVSRYRLEGEAIVEVE